MPSFKIVNNFNACTSPPVFNLLTPEMVRAQATPEERPFHLYQLTRASNLAIDMERGYYGQLRKVVGYTMEVGTGEDTEEQKRWLLTWDKEEDKEIWDDIQNVIEVQIHKYRKADPNQYFCLYAEEACGEDPQCTEDFWNEEENEFDMCDSRVVMRFQRRPRPRGLHTLDRFLSLSPFDYAIEKYKEVSDDPDVDEDFKYGRVASLHRAGLV